MLLTVLTGSVTGIGVVAVLTEATGAGVTGLESVGNAAAVGATLPRIALGAAVTVSNAAAREPPLVPPRVALGIALTLSNVATTGLLPLPPRIAVGLAVTVSSVATTALPALLPGIALGVAETESVPTIALPTAGVTRFVLPPPKVPSVPSAVSDEPLSNVVAPVAAVVVAVTRSVEGTATDALSGSDVPANPNGLLKRSIAPTL